MNRIVPNEEELYELMIEELELWAKQGKDFTAYDMTVHLRQLAPSLEISHDEVRDLMWYANDNEAFMKLYTVEWRDYDTGQQARTWTPLKAPLQTTPVMPAVVGNFPRNIVVGGFCGVIVPKSDEEA